MISRLYRRGTVAALATGLALLIAPKPASAIPFSAWDNYIQTTCANCTTDVPPTISATVEVCTGCSDDPPDLSDQTGAVTMSQAETGLEASSTYDLGSEPGAPPQIAAELSDDCNQTCADYAVVANQLTFFFEVVGSTGVQVPLLMDVTGSTSAGGGGACVEGDYSCRGYAEAYMLVDGNFIEDAYACSSTDSYCNGFSSTADATVSMSVPSNTETEVDKSIVLEFFSNCQTLPGCAFALSAVLDPIIYIDPSFAQASDFSIVFSPGIYGASAPSTVPIPAALPLLASALGGLGLIGWRRRGRRSPLSRSTHPSPADPPQRDLFATALGAAEAAWPKEMAAT